MRVLDPIIAEIIRRLGDSIVKLVPVDQVWIEPLIWIGLLIAAVSVVGKWRQ